MADLYIMTVILGALCLLCTLATALDLAIGVIIYISKVNDEVSNRKKPTGEDEEDEGGGFKYHYGLAFFFAGASFMSSMVASVTNISLYLRRYSNIKDMMLIIPGLEKRGQFYLSHEDELDSAGVGHERSCTSSTHNFGSSFTGFGAVTQSPTIIL